MRDLMLRAIFIRLFMIFLNPNSKVQRCFTKGRGNMKNKTKQGGDGTAGA